MNEEDTIFNSSGEEAGHVFQEIEEAVSEAEEDISDSNNANVSSSDFEIDDTLSRLTI